ncbi:MULTISPECIES: hypothetical protein [Bacteria]|uniref:hypothetical protein n=1 Tax=Bacteria TaxID=2 RepID=UPI003F306414
MKNKIKGYIYSYLIYGYLSTCVLTNIYSLICFKKHDLTKEAFIGNIGLSVMVYPVVWGLKEVGKEYVKIWKEGRLSARLILIFGSLFVLYRVYRNATR